MLLRNTNKEINIEGKRNLYRMMVRIRHFEERCVRSYLEGHIGGFCHTYSGQESIAVGTCSALNENDHVITAYRDHAHALTLGMSMSECMAELYGKITGCSKGKGGSMHFFEPDKNFWGGHGIVGGQVPLGTGIAFALKYKKTNGVCLCYLGDGAVNQGVLFESFNLAELWGLPIIYIIENNRYSMGTSQKRCSAGKVLAARAEGFGISWQQEPTGNDVFKVREITLDALKYTRSTGRPKVIEFDTYRYRGHSMSDPDQTYRTKNEINSYKNEHDCNRKCLNRLISDKLLSEVEASRINHLAKKEAEQAAHFADTSPFPKLNSIQEDVYWETDNNSPKCPKGRTFMNSINK